MFGIHRNFPTPGGGSTSDATAVAADIKSPKTAYVASGKVTGTALPVVYPLSSFNSTASMVKTGMSIPSTQTLTMVAQIKIDTYAAGTPYALFFLTGPNDSFYAYIRADNDATTDLRKKFAVFVQDGAPIVCQLYSSVDVTLGGVFNILFSWNGATGTSYLYVDDTDDSAYGTENTSTTGTMEITDELRYSGFAATVQRYLNDVGYFGIHTGVAIDFSVEANRRKFFDADGDPVVPDESTWSQWGGTQPDFWNAAGELRDNKGSRGNLTLSAGVVHPVFP